MSGIDHYPADTFAHGTRAHYAAGKCRCTPCRRANADYAKSRVGKAFNGLVDAGPARAHLELLAAQGVGRRSVHAACDVALTVLQDIRAGLKTRIRAETARRILAVDDGARADHALVDAKATRAAIRELLKYGLTKGEIASRLGSEAKTPSLQVSRRQVTALNAMKVQRLLKEVRAEVEVERRIGSICTTCGDSHEQSRRIEWLRAQKETDREILRELRPCWYGGRNNVTLGRDLATLRRGDA